MMKGDPVFKLTLADEAVEALRNLSSDHPHPWVRQKGLVVLLKSQGVNTNVICKTADVCANTVRHYTREYQAGGIDRLQEVRFHRPKSKLVSFEQEIRAYLDEIPPTTIKQACAEIAALTGVEIRQTQMRKYLKSLGATCKKVAAIPAKIDIEAQRNFKQTQLNPKLEEAKVGKRDVYFVDAAHFVLGAFLGFLWCIKRVFVRAPSGRQRFNVLGALHAVSKQLVTLINNTYITSAEVCELLRKLAHNASKPITVVLDNARYQRCALVQGLAQDLGIELLFLPPYSPNLNLIERVWKLVKKECLNSTYYDNFTKFRDAISGFVDNMHITHAGEASRLLTLNFQLFTPEQVLKAA